MITEALAFAVAIAICVGIVATASHLSTGHRANLSKSRLARAQFKNAASSATNGDRHMKPGEQIIRRRNHYQSDERTYLAFLLNELSFLLERAGICINVYLFIFVHFIFGFFFAFGASNKFELSFVLSFAISTPIFLFSSRQILRKMRKKEIQRFQQLFPDALDLIVRSVRAGLPVSESMKVVGIEISDPVGGAFREIANNLAIGISLDEALHTLEKSVPTSEVKFFTISLSIQQETGGNLAEILDNLAKMMRKRLQIHKKIRALSSEARASAYIIGSLPFLVGLAIFVLNREYIEILFVDPTGRLFLFGALGSIFLGALVIAKLIRFEI